jgi:hypothetical protein
MAEQRSGQPRRFGRGFAMICAGFLVLVPSGLCTGFFNILSVVGMISSSPSGYETGIFWLSLMFGGPPILLGIALIFVGMRLNRS